MTEPAKPPSPPSDTGPLPTDEEAIRAAVAALAARLAPDGPPKDSGVTLAPAEVPRPTATAAATAAAVLAPVTVVPGRAAPPPQPVEPPKLVEIAPTTLAPPPPVDPAEAPDRPVKLQAAPRRGPGRLIAALLLLLLLIGGAVWLLRDHPQVAGLLDSVRPGASEPKQASAPPPKPVAPPTAPAPTKPDSPPPAPPTAVAPAAPPPTAPTPPATEPAPPAAAPTAPTPAEPPKAATPPATTPPAKPDIAASPPTFDNVFVRDGRAVISGRAPPGAQVEVKLGDRTVARVEADARGEWVAILDTPLPPGAHEFRLVHTPPGGTPVPADRTVAVLVPPPAAPPPLAAAPPVAPAALPPTADAAKPDTPTSPPSASVPAPPPPPAPPLAVATPTKPGGASQVLQSPPLARAGDLVLGTVDYDDAGRMTITGQANPGETVRVYMNNELVGDAIAGADGKWTLAPGRATAHGPQRLRVDRLTAGGPGVAHRLEVPFERVTVKAGDAVTIVRGDNLWNIARGALGSGERYTVIYEANRNQIRDPNLIYPGQVFVIPKPR